MAGATVVVQEGSGVRADEGLEPLGGRLARLADHGAGPASGHEDEAPRQRHGGEGLPHEVVDPEQQRLPWKAAAAGQARLGHGLVDGRSARALEERPIQVEESGARAHRAHATPASPLTRRRDRPGG